MKKTCTELRGKKEILEILAHRKHFSLIKNKSYNHFLIDQSFLMLLALANLKYMTKRRKPQFSSLSKE